MTINKFKPRSTLLVNFFTCLAYEATRISGWYHRHSVSGGVWDPGGSDPTWLEIAVNTWDPFAFLVYLAFLSPFIVVISNLQSLQIRKIWFFIAVIALLVISANIPYAISSRYISTDELIVLVYVVFVVFPAAIFTVYGISKMIANKRKQLKADAGNQGY